MDIFIVGGAVRDMLMGRPPKDIDLLVVGVDELLFSQEFPEAQKVGNHFPVYLINGEEYALARTEKKSGSGHTGFCTVAGADVTLEDDLLRRDLTINAMAMCPENGMLVADHRSLMDINNRILRHNSLAFSDDPLRVIRVARFNAQLTGFTVHPETINLMRGMKEEVSGLPAERVFEEFKKALVTDPRTFFEVLRAADCLDYWFPEIEALFGVPAGPDTGKHAGEKDVFDHTMRVVEGIPPEEEVSRFAGLCHDLGKALSPEPPKHYGHDREGVPLAMALSDRLKVPNAYRKAAALFTEQHLRMHKALVMGAGKAVDLVTLANKGMPGGLEKFLLSSIGDGMPHHEAREIFRCFERVAAVRLPRKYHGRGKSCAATLHQLRCSAWTEVKKDKEK